MKDRIRLIWHSLTQAFWRGLFFICYTLADFFSRATHNVATHIEWRDYSAVETTSRGYWHSR